MQLPPLGFAQVTGIRSHRIGLRLRADYCEGRAIADSSVDNFPRLVLPRVREQHRLQLSQSGKVPSLGFPFQPDQEKTLGAAAFGTGQTF